MNTTGATSDMLKVGDKVRFINEQRHAKEPWKCPKVGTIGDVVGVNGCGNDSIHIKWEKGSTSMDDRWHCNEEDVELLTEIKEEVKIPKLLVKAPIRAIIVGDTITINSKKYRYVESGSEAIVLSISDKSIVCLTKDGSMFTIDNKHCKLADVEVLEPLPVSADIIKKTPKNTTIQVGDRVVCVKCFSKKPNVGDFGKVVNIVNDKIYQVEWEKDIDGHNCNGLCKERHGWNVMRSCIELADKQYEGKQERDTNFTVGEWVRIRDWEDMEKEFGLDEYGSTNCGFTKGMRVLCGMYMRISKIDGNIISFDNELYGIKSDFIYSKDMIEKIPTYKAGDKVRVRSLEALKQNFGVDREDGEGCIEFPYGCRFWTKEYEKDRNMENLCGNVYKTEKDESVDNVVIGDDNMWYVSKFAVEKVL